MANDGKEFMIEDARIIFRNFSGKEGPYNREGERSFCAILSDDVAVVMEADDWNVRYLKVQEEGDIPTPYIPIAVNFKNRPPRVVMITSVGKTTLTEETVGVLDWADIKMVDLIARGYEWVVNGKTGTKAYLQTLVITINEDALERKYGMLGEEH